MIICLGDFVKKREKRGEKWPTRKLIYQWKHYNYFNFCDLCIRKLGKKLLIDEEAFDLWLEKTVQPQKNIHSKNAIIEKKTNQKKGFTFADF